MQKAAIAQQQHRQASSIELIMQRAFVDIRIFYPCTPSYRNQVSFKSIEESKNRMCNRNRLLMNTASEIAAWVKSKKIMFSLIRTVTVPILGSRSREHNVAIGDLNDNNNKCCCNHQPVYCMKNNKKYITFF